MTAFFERLEARTESVGSLLCIGLDPHRALLPEASAAAARDFCLRLIEETAPYAAAFKPNAAFFEVFGAEGWQALKDVIAAAKESGAPVILDAKRGDIASTAEAYAAAVFETLGAQAVTLNPWLGGDALAPFIRQAEQGVFLLCKTSNPGSADLQDLPLEDGRPLYLHLAEQAQTWNTQNNVGLVVGATHPEAMQRVRAAAPDLWFLAPGIGAQGGDLSAALRAGLRADGKGMLVSVSRSIARDAHPGRAAARLREQIAAHMPPARSPVSAPQPAHLDIIQDLVQLGCLRFGEFQLKSGQISPFYIDLRRLVASPPLMKKVAAAYAKILQTLEFDHLAALPYAALPIGAAVSLHGNWPLIYPRKEAKSYGTKALIEGVYQAGQRAVVLDDLITTGESKLEGIAKLTAAGLEVRDIVVLIDRQAGGSDFMAQHGYRLHSVFTLPEMLRALEETQLVPAHLLQKAWDFLA